jgi:hypothetical protein
MGSFSQSRYVSGVVNSGAKKFSRSQLDGSGYEFLLIISK